MNCTTCLNELDNAKRSVVFANIAKRKAWNTYITRSYDRRQAATAYDQAGDHFVESVQYLIQIAKEMKVKHPVDTVCVDCGVGVYQGTDLCDPCLGKRLEDHV